MAELRNIAPSPHAEASSSSSARQTSTPNTSGTSSAAGNLNDSGDSGHRRRRHTGQVSALACVNCRRARARCDGERPAACSRCSARQLICQYEPHTKTHKDDLLKEIETMRAEHADLQDEHQGLQESQKQLEKINLDQSIILDILTNNGHVEEIIKRLRGGESQDSVARWLKAQPELQTYLAGSAHAEKSLLAVVQRMERLYGIHTISGGIGNQSHWTDVTQSPVLIRHLFELYFTWVHPVHMLFGEMNFIKSFVEGSDAHCSSALVNAICAMACHLLDNPAAGLVGSQFRDRANLREGFMKEARRLLRPGSQLPMTAVQAFAIMYLVDLSSGKARNAAGYLRCAADHLELPSDTSQHTEETMQLSAWGIHTLNTAWSGITYQKPFNPVSPKTEVFINVQMDKDSLPAYWRYYRQPGDDTHNPKRPSYALITACEQAKLFRVVHDTINVYCGARGRVTAASVIGCYKRFLEWKANLPPQVSGTDEESQPLPHVLSLHVQYHTALVQLFSPLAGCSYFAESDAQHIGNMIAMHARTGLEHISHCMRLYSCRYNMPLTAFCVIHLGDALLSVRENTPPDVVIFCLEVLEQNRAGFPVCGPLQQVFWQRARVLGVELPEDARANLALSDERYGVDEILDACTRLSYAQPNDQIKRYIDSGIGEHWREEWYKQIGSSGFRKPSTADRAIQITSLLNT